MKERKTKIGKKHILPILIAALMSIAMLITVPQLITQVRADEGDPALVLGTGALSKNANGEKAQILSYGGQDWYVIAYDGKNGYGEYITYVNAQGVEEALYRENVVTVLQKTVSKDTAFRKDSDAADANEYGKSDLLAYFKAQLTDETKPILSKQEQSAIAARQLAGGTPNLNEEGYDDNKIKGADVTDAVLWPLSVAEASTLPNPIRVVGDEKFWWLRTPGEDDRSVAMVWAGGDISDGGSRVSNPVGVRAALDLNRNAVLFTSAAEGGKTTATEGTDGLTPIGPNKNNRWKVTLKDDGTIPALSGHKNFEVTSVTTTCDGNSLNIGYKGAVAGTNEYVSAVIINYEGTITYYGRLGFASADANASVTVNLGNMLGEGDKLYVFNEQCNGDNKTDYASALKEVVIPPVGHDWAFTGFTWFEDGDGYTGAEANYACKNDPEHTTSIAAYFNVIEVAPTCTEGGKTTFVVSVSADYSLDGQEHSENRESAPTDPIGHAWAFADFSWTGDEYSGYTEAAAVYVCQHDESHVQTVTATVTEETVAPTCIDTGRTNYTAVVSAEESLDGVEHSAKVDAKYIDPLGHDYEFTGFTWAGDEESGYTGAEAHYKCKRDESHTTAIPLNIIIEETAPTCTESGKTVFTAAIGAGDSPDAQDHSESKEAKTSEPLGHEWEFVNFSWTGEEATGYTKVVGGYRCTRNSMHTKAVDAECTEKVIEATCTEDGKTTYTAHISAADSLDKTEHTGTKDAKITKAKGHVWEFAEITWTGDAANGYTKATINYKCKADAKHTQAVDIPVTEKKIEPTCTTDGKTTYTTTIAATVSLDKKEHTASKDAKIIKAKGHDWAFVEFLWAGDDVNGYTAAKASYKCKTDPSHTQTVDASISQTVVPPTTESAGRTVYTAIITKNLSLDKMEHTANKDAMAVDKITYTVSEGDKSTWEKGSDSTLDFTVNRSIDDSQTYGQFRELLIDGGTVANSHYTVSAGSLNVSLKASYLETLAEGPHTLTVVFGDATSSEVTFIVAPKGSKTNPSGGGGNGKAITWIIVGGVVILAGIAAAVILLRKRDKKQV